LRPWAARADDTSCTGNLFNATIKGNLEVPKGASCLLVSSTVTGNVQVEAGANLSIANNVTIGGNIHADRCNSVSMQTEGGNIFVGGNVQIRRCTAGGGYDGAITISGNFTCDNNLGSCGAGSGAIGGNVRVNNNSGRVTIINTIAGNVQVNNNSGVSDVSRNIIGGNLQCAGNTGVTDPRGANTVAGKKQGQCAGL